MNLLIGIPTLDYINVEFVRCLLALEQRLKDEGVPYEVRFESGTLVYAARERIAQKAINGHYTHVLWLDADMVFKPNILDDLMDNGKDYCCGVFHSRRPGYASCIFKSIDIGKPNGVERYEEYPNDVFEIAGSGFGCVLTSKKILETVCLQDGTCFLPKAGLGEDLAFCDRAKKHGFKLYCDPHVVIGHIGHITIWPEDRERWKQTISNYNEV